MKSVTLFLVVLLATIPYLLRAADPAAADPLVGSYAWESGGLDLVLTLEADGTYHAVYSGCLGTYGVAEGRWATHDSLIVLSPKEDPAGAKYPLDHCALRNLRVVAKDDALMLVRTEDEGDEMTRHLRHSTPNEFYAKVFHRRPSR